MLGEVLLHSFDLPGQCVSGLLIQASAGQTQLVNHGVLLMDVQLVVSGPSFNSPEHGLSRFQFSPACKEKMGEDHAVGSEGPRATRGRDSGSEYYRPWRDKGCVVCIYAVLG